METITPAKINVKVFLDWIKTDHRLQIIDIREQYEYEFGHIAKSMHIPMDEILQSIQKIQKENRVILYCRSGRRSAAVKYMLERENGFKNIQFLEGGYEAYLNAQNKPK